MRSLVQGLMLFGALSVISGCSNVVGPEQELEGRQIYDRYCARCHGVDGRPTSASPGARDLSNRAYIKSLSSESIRMVIMQGRPSPGPDLPALMPAFGNQFSEPELQLLLAYIRSLSDPALDPARLTPKALRSSGER